MTETTAPRYSPWALGSFFGALVLIGGLARIGFVPIQGYLKDVLHLSAAMQSTGLLLIAVPTFFAFVFGFIRDRWHPFNLPDRGILLLVCPFIAVVNVVLAFSPLTFFSLITCVFLSTAGFALAVAAIQGQMADVAKRAGLSGLLATVTQTMTALAAVATALLGGYLADNSSHRTVFLSVAAVGLVLLAVGMIRPEGVYYRAHVAPKVDWSALRTRPTIWIALLIWFLWAFAPAAQTPLFNYTKDVLKLSSGEYGTIVAIQQASFFPTLILYAILCRKFSLRTLLWVGTAIGVIQWIPIIFVHSQMGAILWAGVFIGLTGGIATGAYFDLVIRSCPKEFTGMGITLAIALVEVATRFGDLLGSWLYDVSGFFWCAIATTGVYALIFPLLLPIPKEITAPAEGTPTT